MSTVPNPFAAGPTEKTGSPSWTVMARGQLYGPYTLPQMQRYIAEGRVRQATLVHAPGRGDCQAGDDPVLAQYFARLQSRSSAFAEPIAAASPEAARKFGRRDDDRASQLGHFVIAAELKSGSVGMLANAISKLGHAFQLSSQVWLLTTAESVNAVRNALVQKLGRTDTLFIVDASSDKAAWFNYGPEGDARIRHVWTEAVEAGRAAVGNLSANA